jgi:hypothetical protein
MATKKAKAVAAPPLTDEELTARLRAALKERARSKAELAKSMGSLSKADATRALDIARELARNAELYRFAKSSTEIFYASDPVATLDRAVAELLGKRGPLSAAALKQAVKAELPGHDALLGDWSKSALARGVIYEVGKPKAWSSTPPVPDLRKLLGKQLDSLQKQIGALEAKGVARAFIADFLRRELDLRSPAPAATPAPATSSREVFLEALRRFAADNPKGALLPVRELRARAGLGKQDFDAAALSLSREGVLTLHHHDHASALSDAEQNALVRDAVGRHYIGVALRGTP